MCKVILLEEALDRLVKNHNGKIEIYNYIKQSDVAHFKCLICNYEWDVKAGLVVNGKHGCPNCAIKNGGSSQRLSKEHVKNYIESFNCKWICGDYINNISKLQITFECGHTSKMTFASFQDGHRCYECGRKSCIIKQRKNEKDIISLIESYGFIFEGFPEGYNNSDSLVSYVCNIGHKTTRKYKIFKKHPNCHECITKEALLNRSGDLKYAIGKIEERGLKFIDGEYVNEDSKLLIEFECGHREWMRYVLFRIKTNNLCLACSKKLKGEEFRTPSNEIIKSIEDAGFIFCNFVGEYEGNTTKVEYFCTNCDTITTRNIAAFLKNKTCFRCRHLETINKQRGENSIWWKGGVSRISLYLRRIIGDWYVESLKKTNFLCEVTGEHAKVVHHLYPFYKIVDETIAELGFDKRKTVGDYSTEELETISKLFLEKHYSYGLGVPMTKKCHNLFHLYYTTMNNTPAQFTEFKQRIQSGEIQLPG
jgi:hypothetical protein